MLYPTQYIRPMRGGAQSHLVQCSDGHYYVLKNHDNPQGRRILANEFIATAFFRALDLPVPEVAAVQISAETVEAMPELRTKRGCDTWLPWATGYAFGSRWIAGVPDCNAAYDFLPDSMLAKLDHNIFVGALVADKWLGQVDSRQVSFYRECGEFRPVCIDHGFILDGPYWEFSDRALSGMYFKRLVYAGANVASWVERVQELSPRRIMREATDAMPEGWLERGEYAQLIDIADELNSRKKGLPLFLRAALQESARREMAA